MNHSYIIHFFSKHYVDFLKVFVEVFSFCKSALGLNKYQKYFLKLRKNLTFNLYVLSVICRLKINFPA